MIINKKAAAVFLAACLFIAKAFSLGAGAQTGIKPAVYISNTGLQLGGLTTTFSGSFKLGRFPIVAGSGLELGKLKNTSFLYGFYGFADYWLIDLHIKGTWNFYSGFGLCSGILTPDFNDWNFYAGARFFAGVSWLYYDNFLELYLQANAAPTWQKNLKSSASTGALLFSLPLEFGLRMHF